MQCYIIRKHTRIGTLGYGGPSCELAGVPRCKVYTDREEAEADVDKLNKHNPVGFDVVPVRLQEIEDDGREHSREQEETG